MSSQDSEAATGEKAEQGGTDAEKTPDQLKVAALEAQAADLTKQLAEAEHGWRIWKAIAAAVTIVAVVVAGCLYLRPWSKGGEPPASIGQQGELTDVQLSVSDGTIPLVPPDDADPLVFENFVYSAVVEAHRWYGDYFRASGMSVGAPSIYSVSSTKRETHPTLCLPEDVANDHPYVFFCADDNVVWLPQVTLMGTWFSSNVLAVDTEQAFSPQFAAAAVGVYGYSTAVIKSLGNAGYIRPLHRLNDDLVAACLTGVWMGTGRRLSPAVVHAAAGAIMRYSDPAMLRHSAQQVREALQLALDTGRPVTCLKAYVPGFASPSPSARPSASPSRRSPQLGGVPSVTPGTSKSPLE